MAKCLLCDSNESDIKYGEFLQKDGIIVHEYCLYLSSGLVQNGEDNDGLFGFLKDDIRTERERVKHLRCYYCREPYANLGCCLTKCRHSFHMICGMKNGCQNQFVGTFKSYCKTHARKFSKHPPPYTESCCICYDQLKQPGQRTFATNFIEAPCCRNGWFHRECVQSFARTAGYFFKCPLCNDTKKFREQMPYRGIFIPDRDAAWELEPNAFAELLERPSKCAADVCCHKKGRNEANEKNPHIFCVTCGAVAIHKFCLANRTLTFNCSDCLEICNHSQLLIENDSGRESLQALDHDQENEDVDVCNNSESEDEIDFLERQISRRALCRQIVFDSSSESGDESDKNKNNQLISSPENNENTECSRKDFDKKQKKYGLNDDTDSDQFKSPLNYERNNKDCFDSSSSSSLDSLCMKNKVNGILRRKRFISSESDDSCKMDSQRIDSQIENSQVEVKRRKIISSTNETNSSNALKICYSVDSSSSSEIMENTHDISCIANRTRHRKLSTQRNNLKPIPEVILSDTSSNRSSIQTTSFSRLSSLSPAFAAQKKNYSETEKVNCASNRNYSSRIPTSSSTSSQSDLNISCVANRTRRRKSIYYDDSSFEIVKEDNTTLSTSIDSNHSDSSDFKNSSDYNVRRTRRRKMLRLDSSSSTDSSGSDIKIKPFGPRRL